MSKQKYRVIEQDPSPRGCFNFSPLVTKKYRIEFYNYGSHWLPHNGAGQFDSLDQAIAWVDSETTRQEPQPRVVYERETC